MMTPHHETAASSTSGSASAQTIFSVEESYFTVFAGGEVFGLSVESAQTIFRIESVSPVPGAPPEIVGLVNLRGKIVMAVSLRSRLGMPRDGSFKDALAIGVEHKSENFALIIDQVGDVFSLRQATSVPTPPHLDMARARLMTGLYQVGDMLVPVLDIGALFDFSR
ncbi:MAG: chemotaxis protein CheW [Hyphomicrobiaceae bacterium]